jgi:hypothetical protein
MSPSGLKLRPMRRHIRAVCVRDLIVRNADRIGVMRSEQVDVLDHRVKRVDQPDRKDAIELLRPATVELRVVVRCTVS